MASIHIPYTDKVHELSKPCLVIGRADGVDLEVSWSADVSREHAKLERDANGDYWITDQSRNGTLLNGSRIQRAEQLCHGDIIGIGKRVALVFLAEEGPFRSGIDSRSARTTTVVLPEGVGELLEMAEPPTRFRLVGS